MISEGSSDLQAGVLVRVMDDDMITISSDVHRREEIRAVQQQCVAQASNGTSCHFEGCHCCSVVPSLHWYL